MPWLWLRAEGSNMHHLGYGLAFLIGANGSCDKGVLQFGVRLSPSLSGLGSSDIHFRRLEIGRK